MRNLIVTAGGLALLATLFGLLNANLLLGWAVVNPANLEWLTNDNATHHLGWAFYRFESGWTFPVSWTSRVGYPAGASIGFLDSVPLLAVFLRPLGPLLPEPFQYLGLYAALCFVLQAYFGFRLCQRLFPQRPASYILGGAFFLLSPPMTWLVFGHYPHLAHWLVLAGLESYFRETAGVPPLKWMGRQWVVLAVAGGINPYLAAMCFLVSLAAIARLLLERRCGWRLGGLLLPVTPAVLALSLLTFGFVAPRDPGSVRGPGYREFSLNLLAPVNPMSFGSILIPRLPIISDAQFEGYNYLGIGIIALLALGLLRGPRAVLWLGDRRIIPLVGLALVCTAAAVSATPSFGSSTLFHLELPEPLAAVAEGLRASGRLFWPAHYLLITAAISLTHWQWRIPYSTVILATALGLQVADLRQLRSAVHTVTNVTADTPLRSPVWQQLGRNYDSLIVLPPYQCGPDAAPGGKPTYRIFGMVAAAQRMRTNSYYAARYTKDEMTVHCRDLPGAILKGQLEPRTLYVVSDKVRTVLDMSHAASHQCEIVDGFNLCTLANAGSPDAVRWKPNPNPYAIGQMLDFTATGNARPYMLHGRATAPGVDGTWTEGAVAKLLLGLPGPVSGPVSLILDAQTRAFVTETNPRLDVDVVVNGQPVDHWTFSYGDSAQERHTSIPRSVIYDSDILDIEFRLPNAQAPAYVVGGNDVRFLGLNVHQLTLVRAGN